jgi:hypothetical protein
VKVEGHRRSSSYDPIDCFADGGALVSFCKSNTDLVVR